MHRFVAGFTRILLLLSAPASAVPTIVLPEPNVELSAPASVSVMLRLPDGRSIIAGAFDRVRGQRRYGLARLNTDGSLDESWFPRCGIAFHGYARCDVRAMALAPDGSLVIAGDFWIAEGAEIHSLAKLSAVDGSPVASWNPLRYISLGWGGVRDIAVSGAAVYALSNEYDPNAQQTRGIIRKISLAGSGEIDTTFRYAASGFLAAIEAGDGQLFAAAPDSAPRRIDPVTGAVDASWNPTLPERTSDLSFDTQSHALFAAGTRLLPGFVVTPVFVRLVPSSVYPVDAAWAPATGFDRTASRIVTDGAGAVYLYGCSFAHCGVRRTAASGSGALDPTFAAPTPFRELQVLAAAPGMLWLSGDTESNEVFGPRGSALFRIDAQGSVDASYRAEVRSAARNDAVAVDALGRTVLAGSFTRIDGLRADGLARILADGTVDQGWAPVLGPADYRAVRDVAIDGVGDVYVAGMKETIGQPQVRFLRKFSAAGSEIAGWNALGTASVSQLLVDDEQDRLLVLARGNVCGVDARGLVRITLSAPCVVDLDALPDIEGDPGDLALHDDWIYLAGAFTRIDGTSLTQLARMRRFGPMQLDAQWRPSVGTVDRIEVSGDALFTMRRWAPTTAMRKLLLPSATVDPQWGVPDWPYMHPVDIATLGTTWLALRGTDSEDGNAITRVAQSYGWIDTSWLVYPYPYASGVGSMTADVEGRLLVAGSFHAIGGTTRDGFAALAGLPPLLSSGFED